MRLVLWLLALISKLLGRRQAQQAVDSAAITRNQEAAHAAQAAQAAAPRTRADLADSVLRGDDF